MGYDYRTSGSATAGSISPLAGPRYDLTDTIDAYLARIDASKIILGVPYYGRAWSTTSDAPNARTRKGSATTGYSTSVLYTTAIETAAKHGRRWDATEATPWTAYKWKACSDCPTTWRELYYDDATSLGLKYDLVNARGLRGAGIWALGYDGSRPELYALLKAKFREDSTAPVAGIQLLPSTTRDATIQVRWTGRDDTAVERYDVQVSVDGGAWSTWQNDTRRTSATYVGERRPWLRLPCPGGDKKGHWSDWNVGDVWRASSAALKVGAFVRVTADALTLRASADSSARKVGRVVDGGRLRIAGGPRTRDGSTWYEVVGPLKEWGPVATSTRTNAWVATSSGSGSRVKVVRAPNTTSLDVLIDDLAIGAVDLIKATRATSTGAPSALPAAFSPSGDKVRDGLRIAYRLDAGLDALTLRVVRASDGASVGSRALPGRSRGRHVYDWDGTLGGKRLPDGAYLIQLVGKAGSTSAAAPAAAMTDPTIDLGAWTASIDTSPPTVSAVTASVTAISPDGDGRQDGTTLKAASRAGCDRLDVAHPGSGRRPGPVVPGHGSRDQGDLGRAGGEWLPRRRWQLPGRGPRRRRARQHGDGQHPARRSTRSIRAGASRPPCPASWAGRRAVRSRPTATAGRTTWCCVSSAASRSGGASRSATERAGSSGRRAPRWAPRRASPGRGAIERGRTLRDGTYRVTAKVTDAAGNRSTLSGTVRIDRTAGFLRPAPGLFFPQDNDSLARATKVSFKLRGRATTTLRVIDATGAVVRTAWKGRVRPAGTTAWTWDGRDGSGAMLPRGEYRLELVATAGGTTQIVRRDGPDGCVRDHAVIVGADTGQPADARRPVCRAARHAPAGDDRPTRHGGQDGHRQASRRRPLSRGPDACRQRHRHHDHHGQGRTTSTARWIRPSSSSPSSRPDILTR